MISEVYNCDCMEYMKTIPDKFFDLAVVDPPYGLADKLTQGGTWANKYKKGDADWDKKPDEKYFLELFRVSKNQIIWGANYFNNLPANRCFLVWDKIAQMDTLADCEYAWTSFDKNAKIFRHVRNTNETRIHITQKPIALYDWIYKNYVKAGDKIFDSHLGSGSSRISAHKAGLDFWGCELDPEYFEAACERYQKFISQLNLFGGTNENI